MPRLEGTPSRIYTESAKISEDTIDFSLSVSYNLLDTTNVESLETKRIQGIRDSSSSFNSFLDSERVNITDDKDFAFMFMAGTEPYPVMLFEGLVTESKDVSRGSDAAISRAVSIQQGTDEGFRDGNWKAVERNKQRTGHNVTYKASKTVEEVWVSHGLTATLSDADGTNDMITVDARPLSEGDPLLIVFKTA